MRARGSKRTHAHLIRAGAGASIIVFCNTVPVNDSAGQRREAVLAFNGDVQVEPFSSLKKQGVDKLRQKLDTWFSELEPATEAEEE